MGKKIIYIVLGGLVIFGVLFLLWSWLFNGGQPLNQNNGQFGTGSSTSQNGGGVGTDTGNGQVGLGQGGTGQNTTNGTIPLGENGSGGTTNGTGGGGTNGTGSTNTTGTNGTTGTTGTGSTVGGAGGTGTSTFNSGSVGVSGVNWLYTTAGTSGGTGSTGGSNPNLNGFNPTNINGINNGTLGGTVPTVGGAVNDPTNSNSGINTLLASGLIGAASCALQASGTTLGSFIAGGTAASLNITTVSSVPVSDLTLKTLSGAQTADRVGKNVISFQGCITNVLAKAALQQITASVVNWINSGFNGQPSFITNYQQFFTNVADVAAGEFIKGAGLSFLCSAFKPQIKIAIAQSYAQRSSAQSCTLTSVIKNVNSFMNGNFSQGGWPGFISFTTMPANNPYGAFAFAQIGLATAQSNALGNAKNNISPNGFLSLQKLTCNGSTSINANAGVSGSQAALAGGSVPAGCKVSITTPGKVIEDSLADVLKSPIDQLGLADNLNQILNALTTQLVTKTLQNGLTSLSGTTGYQNNYQTPEQQQAQQQAQNILTNLQTQVTYSQQYAAIQQGSIVDIQNAQGQLNTLGNCWIVVASSTNSTSAAANASTAQATLASLDDQVNIYNNNITFANANIAQLQELQSDALSVGSVADVTALVNQYNAIQAATPFISQSDVATAQQNRATLQSQMNTLNLSTQAGLAQCNAAKQN